MMSGSYNVLMRTLRLVGDDTEGDNFGFGPISD